MSKAFNQAFNRLHKHRLAFEHNTCARVAPGDVMALESEISHETTADFEEYDSWIRLSPDSVPRRRHAAINAMMPDGSFRDAPAVATAALIHRNRADGGSDNSIKP